MGFVFLSVYMCVFDFVLARRIDMYGFFLGFVFMFCEYMYLHVSTCVSECLSMSFVFVSVSLCFYKFVCLYVCGCVCVCASMCAC